MAEYQILYWQNIPLSIKATDENGTIRQNLSGPFEEAMKNASDGYRQAMHSTDFQWSSTQSRAGSAAEVIRAVTEELAKSWDDAESLA